MQFNFILSSLISECHLQHLLDIKTTSSIKPKGVFQQVFGSLYVNLVILKNVTWLTPHLKSYVLGCFKIFVVFPFIVQARGHQCQSTVYLIELPSLFKIVLRSFVAHLGPVGCYSVELSSRIASGLITSH